MVELAGGRTVRLFFICLSHYPPSGAQDFRIISQANSQVQYGAFFLSAQSHFGGFCSDKILNLKVCHLASDSAAYCLVSQPLKSEKV